MMHKTMDTTPRLVIVARIDYAPGWDRDAVSMMTSRSAAERAACALDRLSDGMRVLDVGCGPGTISMGLARAIAPSGRLLGVDAEISQVTAALEYARRTETSQARFVAASAYDLPVETGSVDVYFSHALYEHLQNPERALFEARRVLRPGGALAVAASDWSRARFDPLTADIELAMSGHYALRRQAGGDPFAGSGLRGWVQTAGFVDIAESVHQRVDLGYQELAAYVRARLLAAAPTSPPGMNLGEAALAADRWATETGTVTQCWVEVTAIAP